MNKSIIVLNIRVFILRCQVQILTWKREHIKKKIARLDYLIREVNRK